MKDTKARNLLVTIIDNLIIYLTSVGWLPTQTLPQNPTPKDVFITEAFPEEKINCNTVAITFGDIREPLPVEIGNSKRVKQVREIAISCVGIKENIAQALALDVKAYFDSLNLFEYFDEEGISDGVVEITETQASRVFIPYATEWKKFWWVVSILTQEYYDLD